MLRHYEKMLRQFPFSRLNTDGSVLRVSAVSWMEPPLLELPMEDPLDIDLALSSAREFVSGDCAVQLETRWDLWQYDREWAVAPAPVILSCFGPRFESEMDDHLRIDFGIDLRFLPQPDIPDSAFMAQSNIRSLLHLTAELDRVLNVEGKKLWSDSGENFAERLQSVLETSER